MNRRSKLVWPISCLAVLLGWAQIASPTDISGTITTTLMISDNSNLVGDVTCTVTGAPCIEITAPRVTLKLNGFAMTGQADPYTACSGGTITEDGNASGILASTQSDVSIEGPGLIERFRGFGINIRRDSTRVKVTGVTLTTNCFSGIFLSASSDNEVSRVLSVRNGSPANPCGGI